MLRIELNLTVKYKLYIWLSSPSSTRIRIMIFIICEIVIFLFNFACQKCLDESSPPPTHTYTLSIFASKATELNEYNSELFNFYRFVFFSNLI